MAQCTAGGAVISDKCKEQIMRSATYALAAAFLALVWQFSAASAQTRPAPSALTPPSVSAQTPPAQSALPDNPQAQSPVPNNPAVSIPNQKLDAAAAAMQRVASLRDDYLQLLEDALPDDQPRILNEANNALQKAITDQGLSVEEFTTIMERAQNDPQVRQKIIERIQAPAKEGQQDPAEEAQH
jgi:hypothetical protein